MENGVEMVVLVDEGGAPVGEHRKATVHGRTTPRHLAFSCHVVDDRGRVLMTRRSLDKQTWPGVWTNAFCGHPAPGEPIEEAVHRRARFELGLEIEILSCPLPDFGYTATDASGVQENEHCPVFVARALSPAEPDPAEVAEMRWTTPARLTDAVDAAPWAFSPWLVEHLPGLLPGLTAAVRSGQDEGRPLPDALDDRLGVILASARREAERFGPDYARLWDSIAVVVTEGKKIRPRLLLGAYDDLGGRDRAAAVDAACAVEILHAAFVIHDDVIDGDLTRRGRENVTGSFAAEARARGASRRDARAWGEASSILAGDLLLTRAHALLAGLEVAEPTRRAVRDLFDATVFETAAGEHADVRLSMHLDPATPEEVLRMIERKTAAYSFRAPLVLAATLAGSGPQVIDDLDRIARRIGILYQLRDDVLGTFGDERETGKSVLSDLREGKETLLISYARTDPSWSGVARHFGDVGLSHDDGARVREVVERSGARVFVEALIEERRAEVTAMIRAADLPAALARRLQEATDAGSLRRA